MGARAVISRVATSAIDAARLLRTGTRDAERAYREGTRFRSSAAGWDSARRADWMLHRLRSVVKTAARTPFYADRFRRAGFDPDAPFTFDDFGQLPVLERDDVAAHREAMCLSTVPEHLRRKDGTGGSTGVPLVYWSGPAERGWRISGQDHFLMSLGVQRWSSTAFLWGHHIDRAERSGWRERMRDGLGDRHWYDCFRLSPDILLEYHRDLTRLRPRCLLAYASALDALATTLLEHGLTASYPTHRIVTGAEKLWPAQRARIERAFSAPVHEQYGSRELGLVAAQRDPGAQLEVDWANLLVEPAVAGGGPSPILVTKLNADVMPMLRYRVGDQALFPSGCRPGHPAWRLDEVVGRMLDGLHTPSGEWLNGIGIPHLMKDRAVREFHIRQNEDFTVDVLVVPATGYNDEEARTIQRILSDNLAGLVVEVKVVAEIPRGAANKWRPVVTQAVPRGVPGTAAVEHA